MAIGILVLSGLALLGVYLALVFRGIRTRSEAWATTGLAAAVGFLGGFLGYGWLAAIGFSILGAFVGTVFADFHKGNDDEN